MKNYRNWAYVAVKDKRDTFYSESDKKDYPTFDDYNCLKVLDTDRWSKMIKVETPTGRIISYSEDQLKMYEHEE